MNPACYFDHAATSYPKSAAVVQSVRHFLEEQAGNPGRGAYELAFDASRVQLETRIAAAGLLGHGNPERILFTLNATEALNLALRGLEPASELVIATSQIEHNAVARTVNLLEHQGASVHRLPTGPDGVPDFARIPADTNVVAVTAGSNVLGRRLPIGAIRGFVGSEPILVIDAAQVAGAEPFDVTATGADLVAVPGHKAIGGPQGVGLLLCSDRVNLQPWRQGGTGGNSEASVTPAIFPDGFEAGTPNGPGIAGLGTALAELQDTDLVARQSHKLELWQRLYDQIASIPSVHVASCADPQHALPLVSFRSDRIAPGDLASQLAAAGYAVRSGLHCAPGAHQFAGTLDTGLVRASVGPGHSPADIDKFVDVVRRLLN